MESISYSLRLTGSSFFDLVMLERARELAYKYPGLSVSRDSETITISGTLSPTAAESFRRELE